MPTQIKKMCHHLSHPNRKHGGFTLVEIMIVVAVIALLAAIAVPRFMRAHKRSLASTVLNELRLIDDAKTQYAAENQRLNDTPASWAMLTPYFKPTSDLAAREAAVDFFGHPIQLGNFDEMPRLNQATRDNFSDVVEDDFWVGYYQAPVN